MTVILAAALVGAVAVYGMYYISPFGRHDREAASYEQSMRVRALQVEGTRVIGGSAQVTSSPGNGGYCLLRSTLEVVTPFTAAEFGDHLKATGEDQIYQKVTQVKKEDSGFLLRIENGTLGEGGTLDLRCG